MESKQLGRDSCSLFQQNQLILRGAIHSELIEKIRNKHKSIFKLIKRSNLNKKKQSQNSNASAAILVESTKQNKLQQRKSQVVQLPSIINLPKELHLDQGDSSIDNNPSLRNHDEDEGEDIGKQVIFQFQEILPNHDGENKQQGEDPVTQQKEKYSCTITKKQRRKNTSKHSKNNTNKNKSNNELKEESNLLLEYLQSIDGYKMFDSNLNAAKNTDIGSVANIISQLDNIPIDFQAEDLWNHFYPFLNQSKQNQQLDTAVAAVITEQSHDVPQATQNLWEYPSLNEVSEGTNKQTITGVTSTSANSSYSRREKSLEELSKKFLTIFLQKESMMISLDKITQQLDVERRRIYDIINILESLKLVTRRGKNNYKWNGFDQIFNTITKQQQQQQSLMQWSQQRISTEEGFAEIDDEEESAVAGKNSMRNNNHSLEFNEKKEKSLEILSIGFLKLFLNYKDTLSLEEAARKLSPSNCENQKIKTKIRRLYDIANVFKSLGLIRKVQLNQTKKPAFQWVGISGLQEFYNSSKSLSYPLYPNEDENAVDEHDEHDEEQEEEGGEDDNDDDEEGEGEEQDEDLDAASAVGVQGDRQIHIEGVEDEQSIEEECKDENGTQQQQVILPDQMRQKDNLVTPCKGGQFRSSLHGGLSVTPSQESVDVRRFRQLFLEEAVSSLLSQQSKMQDYQYNSWLATPQPQQRQLFQESSVGKNNSSRDQLYGSAHKQNGTPSCGGLSSSKNSAFRKVEKPILVNGCGPSSLSSLMGNENKQDINQPSKSIIGSVVIPSPKMNASPINNIEGNQLLLETQLIQLMTPTSCSSAAVGDGMHNNSAKDVKHINGTESCGENCGGGDFVEKKAATQTGFSSRNSAFSLSTNRFKSPISSSIAKGLRMDEDSLDKEKIEGLSCSPSRSIQEQHNRMRMIGISNSIFSHDNPIANKAKTLFKDDDDDDDDDDEEEEEEQGEQQCHQINNQDEYVEEDDQDNNDSDDEDEINFEIEIIINDTKQNQQEDEGHDELDNLKINYQQQFTEEHPISLIHKTTRKKQKQILKMEKLFKGGENLFTNDDIQERESYVEGEGEEEEVDDDEEGDTNQVDLATGRNLMFTPPPPLSQMRQIGLGVMKKRKITYDEVVSTSASSNQSSDSKLNSITNTSMMTIMMELENVKQTTSHQLNISTNIQFDTAAVATEEEEIEEQRNQNDISSRNIQQNASFSVCCGVNE